jgi:hypothetical protein
MTKSVEELTGQLALILDDVSTPELYDALRRLGKLNLLIAHHESLFRQIMDGFKAVVQHITGISR